MGETVRESKTGFDYHCSVSSTNSWVEIRRPVENNRLGVESRALFWTCRGEWKLNKTQSAGGRCDL